MTPKELDYQDEYMTLCNNTMQLIKQFAAKAYKLEPETSKKGHLKDGMIILFNHLIRKMRDEGFKIEKYPKAYKE